MSRRFHTHPTQWTHFSVRTRFAARPPRTAATRGLNRHRVLGWALGWALGWTLAAGLDFAHLPSAYAQTSAPATESAPDDGARRADIPPPPPLLTGPNDEKLEPVVTIRKDGEREVEEYRIRGQLFAIRVKVKGAPAYWLVDPDGSGRMVPGQGIGPTISVPKWVLREF